MQPIVLVSKKGLWETSGRRIREGPDIKQRLEVSALAAEYEITSSALTMRQKLQSNQVPQDTFYRNLCATNPL
jgi:hypothetical protein